MAYGDWTIGGKVPVNIESVERNPATAGGNTDSTLTFHCVALVELLNDDPRTEVEAFNAMSCQLINNDQLLNGGSKLQPQGGDVITITEHTPAGDVDYTAALEPVKVVEDSMADQAIWYDLIAHYELSGKSSSAVYIPDYGAYSNINYHVWTDGSPNSGGGVGTEIGIMNIVEARNVRMVEVKGSACNCPAWLEVVGSTEGKQYWMYSHDHNVGDTGLQGIQTLIYVLPTPTKEITLQTSTHVPPGPEGDLPSNNSGCWLHWIRVVYE